jgi:hypothetical protein
VLYAYFIGFWVLLPIAVATALRWGARPERQIAVTMAIGALMSAIVLPSLDLRFANVEWTIFAIDAAMFLTFGFVATRSGRAWVIWAAAFQGVATIGHLSKLIVPSITQMAYSIMAQASAYPTVIALLIGTWQYRQRARHISSGF